jgi:hypothetical protein
VILRGRLSEPAIVTVRAGGRVLAARHRAGGRIAIRLQRAALAGARTVQLGLRDDLGNVAAVRTVRVR